MVVLKKLKASTLMETLVATVLIVVIFMVASLVMNSLIKTQANSNTLALDHRLEKLTYLVENKQLELPYYEDWNNCSIAMEPVSEDAKIMKIEVKDGIEGNLIKVSERRINEGY